MVIFLLGSWPAYVLDIHPYYRWYALWALTIAQFLFAGVEALSSWWRDRNRPSELPPNVLQFAAYRRIGAEHRPSSATLLAKRAGGDG